MESEESEDGAVGRRMAYGWGVRGSLVAMDTNIWRKGPSQAQGGRGTQKKGANKITRLNRG